MTKPDFKGYNLVYGRTLKYNDVPESKKKKHVAIINWMPKSIQEDDYYEDYMLLHNPDNGNNNIEINRWHPLFHQCILGDIVIYEEWFEPREYSRGGEWDEKNECYIVRTLYRNLTHEKRIKEFDNKYEHLKLIQIMSNLPRAH